MKLRTVVMWHVSGIMESTATLSMGEKKTALKHAIATPTSTGVVS